MKTIVMLILGILMITAAPYFIDRKKLRCTHCVNATIVGEHTKATSTRYSVTYTYSHSPIFQYYVDDVVYRKVPMLHTRRHVHVGMQLPLYVNPLNPNEYYEPESAKQAGRTCQYVGIFLILLTIPQLLIWLFMYLSLLNT